MATGRKISIQTAINIVMKHARHIDLSPGVGQKVQDYAMDVCTDIIADLEQLAASEAGQ